MYLVAPVWYSHCNTSEQKDLCFLAFVLSGVTAYRCTELRRLPFEKQAIKNMLTLNMLWKNHRHQTDFAIVCI